MAMAAIAAVMPPAIRPASPPGQGVDAMSVPRTRHEEVREAVRALCRQYPDAYFRAVDAERGYPEGFVDALTEAGWLAGDDPAGVRRLRARPRRSDR
jgi:acyl-CoA dehydrogenase